MSDPHHPSDKFAAYRGLILGAIAIAAIVVTIVKLTNHKYDVREGSRQETTR
jgi:hypothetical protein